MATRNISRRKAKPFRPSAEALQVALGEIHADLMTIVDRLQSKRLGVQS